MKISLKDVERMKDEAKAQFALTDKPLFILFISEFDRFLKSKGVELDIELEEEVYYEE